MKYHSFKIYCLLSCILLLGPVKQLIAQPFNLNESVQPVELTFTKFLNDGEEKEMGDISLNKFTQEVDTSYYFIKGLSMYAPTYFSLNTTDPEADIKVNLCKENWHQFHQSGDIKGAAMWKTDFKTEGDFGIMVIARKKPIRYVLLVWRGLEMNVEMPSVFKQYEPGQASIAGAGTGSGWLKQNWLILLGGGVALGVIGFLLVKLKKAKA